MYGFSLAGGCGGFCGFCCGLLGSQNFKFENTEITVRNRDFGDARDPGWIAGGRAAGYVRVAGVLRPTSDSEIRFEVWMPEQGWNGAFLVWQRRVRRSIGYGQFVAYIKRGSRLPDRTRAIRAKLKMRAGLRHPERIKDFGGGVHLTAEHGKQIVAAYYGKSAGPCVF